MFFPIKDENPTERKPLLTIALIAANIAVFLFTFFSNDFSSIVREYGAMPKEIVAGEDLHTLFTSMFLHGGPIHLIGNVWFLWIFGDNIEDLFGRPKFLFIYFGSGVLASFAHIALNPASSVTAIGASGAIAGILGAYTIKYPRAKVVTVLFIFLFIHVIKIPSIVFLGVWAGLQMLSGLATTIEGVQVTVAYWAHIGGFLAGMLMAFLLRERSSTPRKEITEEYFRPR
ncbi:hypothetical protein AKJ65_00970 [candidate division MSBL1 archaeon SCGC-AAA259E19]|uniref:Peptidase S54 rhomboid domain-containing protein n=1 Tax=candidate division MSBL1 archaeon SCGC-AAA259E19 TaxID=1698264 RepID=A0A133UNF3_9EURY|nr:hypothetical protein AKJ65_00970 [candidate division MSBL1 archaeon SCGC-AAA259E19]